LIIIHNHSNSILSFILGEREPQLVFATIILAGFTLWLVHATRQLGEIDRRPWFYLDKVSLNSGGYLECLFKNCGKMPISYTIHSLDFKIDNFSTEKAIPHNTGRDVYQGGEESFISSQRVSNAEEMRNLLLNGRALEGTGEISYTYGVIGRPQKYKHFSKFKMYISPILFQDKEGNSLLTEIRTRHFSTS
jgi:hypothetical protein